MGLEPWTLELRVRSANCKTIWQKIVLCSHRLESIFKWALFDTTRHLLNSAHFIRKEGRTHRAISLHSCPVFPVLFFFLTIYCIIFYWAYCAIWGLIFHMSKSPVSIWNFAEIVLNIFLTSWTFIQRFFIKLKGFVYPESS